MAAARRVQSRDAVCAPAPVYAIFGDPVAHSLSPVMHTSAFLHAGLDNIYLAFRVSDIAEAIRAVRALDIRGASITLPHKVSVMAHLDELDDMAARIGAANTIVNRGGRLCGYNSDWQGAVTALAEKTAVNDRQVVVIGAGGAARAVAFGIKKKGGRLTILNRSRKNGEILAAELDANFVPLEEVKKLACDIIINTTPVGMAPHEDTIPLDSRILQKEMVVMDVVYSPLKTRLLAAAEAIGCTIVDGLAMFVYQGAMQFELWTQTDAPVNTMRRAVQDALLPETELI
jgi:shikimate dehydrogenase